jgi:hypothetical protein
MIILLKVASQHQGGQIMNYIVKVSFCGGACARYGYFQGHVENLLLVPPKSNKDHSVVLYFDNIMLNLQVNYTAQRRDILCKQI